MIELYLINKWKQGALAGSQPLEAFSVKVGLGVTMTSEYMYLTSLKRYFYLAFL